MTNAVLSHRPASTSSYGPGLSALAADDPTPLPIALLAAVLCLATGLAHVQDQGGFLGDVSPEWMKLGYYAVEIVAAVTMPFLARQKLFGWLLAAFVSIGPFVGYIASRTVGVPGDPGDVGNWNYTLGTFSLAVEGVLFLVALTVLVRSVRRTRRGDTVTATR